MATLQEWQAQQAARVIDMGGMSTLNNKWHQERLLKTDIKQGFLQNMPNQTYLNVSSPSVLTFLKVIIDLVES